MTLSALDGVVIAVYLTLTLYIGLRFSRRASDNTESFFLAGRTLPWYLVGVSMAATYLAADSPIGVTELVRQDGLPGMWLLWSGGLSIVTASLFFSRLWRRSGVTTDAEFVALRYRDRGAKALRLTRALYLSLVVNCMTLGWVILAMGDVLNILLGTDSLWIPFALVLVALAYSVASGFWGVVATDMLQFIVALSGTITLAWFSLDSVGGASGLAEALRDTPDTLSLFPSENPALLPWSTFAVYLGVQWWAQRNADGGEYLGQRLFAARSDGDAQLGMLLLAVCEMVLNLWPLAIVALVSIVALPEANDSQAYVLMIADTMPAGMRGLLVAAFLAAFMSTVDTQLNWGASYWIQDLYRNFIRPEESEKHYVAASRWAMVMIGLVSFGVSLTLGSVSGAWKTLLALGAGQGLVVLVRWYWWRVTAWCELAAMIASAVVTVTIGLVDPDMQYGAKLLWVAGVSAATWLPIALANRTFVADNYRDFMTRVRPAGWGWRRAYREFPSLTALPMPGLFDWALSILFIYSLTFGVGFMVLGPVDIGLVLLADGVFTGLWLLVRLTHGDRHPPKASAPLEATVDERDS